ncbi:hypothetical protein [Sphingomonas sp.]|uniref:hypothetical protein n=1 Tax=Sphingomonas sp. TaxID=28214 RepID=UPI001DDEB22B|nr:hypothetical protein [Sphingomonas sp.]MBX9796254.1 hypothetical protein [Sphingomonas sp.]
MPLLLPLLLHAAPVALAGAGARDQAAFAPGPAPQALRPGVRRCDYGDDACIDRLIAHPPLLTPARLPRGARIGRCLLEIDGKRLIDGKCGYMISKGGDFHIFGPHQVFDGIDYPEAGGMANMISTDWWADVFRRDGRWAGYSNSEDGIRAVHGQESRWGALRRKGACYLSDGGKRMPEGPIAQYVRVCLWKR